MISPTWEGMVAVDGLLEPEAGHMVLAALEPLARPADANDTRPGRVAPDPGRHPRQPLDLGRSTRVVTPAQRSALTVRDRGCVFPACDRPLAWCDAHHLVSWLDGGPTNLAHLALVGRAHHRAVHEGAGGWPAAPMAGSASPHPSDHTGVPPDGVPEASPTHRARRLHGARTLVPRGRWTVAEPVGPGFRGTEASAPCPGCRGARGAGWGGPGGLAWCRLAPLPALA